MKTIKTKNYGKNEISLVSGLRQNGIRLRASLSFSSDLVKGVHARASVERRGPET